mmetsp:Transcript_7736/g.19089  ORF Transcript_7736/g.19089 Transcript_7736/m.19089 type:complete len:86 (+) Transcript_7736:79-336(+)
MNIFIRYCARKRISKSNCMKLTWRSQGQWRTEMQCVLDVLQKWHRECALLKVQGLNKVYLCSSARCSLRDRLTQKMSSDTIQQLR